MTLLGAVAAAALALWVVAPVVWPASTPGHDAVCRNCGQRPEADARFCSNCGAPLGASAASS